MKYLKEYNRYSAVLYAQSWALSHNPNYKNYEEWGGDCTNFISQCVHAGKIPFDEDGNEESKKWYWYDDRHRTPSWTSAELFYQYIINNNNEKTNNFGIYAREASYNELELGDIVQLLYSGRAYHTMIITKVLLNGDYLIDYLECQHTYNLLDYPLSMKEGEKRYIKILGYYTW
ncbi:MAG: amidase domain-containing protein [Romboutsia sp.]